MKKYIIILIVLTINALNIFACTTFILKTEKELVFGRNLDWVSDNGIIVENKRNVLKTSIVFPPERPIQWTSKYGSITFNQFGKEFPFGGINENGLVVEIMNANAEYPLSDDRPVVNELQWIQYQLDNAKSIDEVINSDKLLRIKNIKQQLHFLICDGSGNAAVIEFKNNKMVVYRDKDLPIPVLENDVYSKSLSKQKSNASCRFTTAADMIQKYKPHTKGSVIDYSFNILDRVKLNASWSIVYDVKKMKIFFKTESNPNIQTIDIKQFDFNCGEQSMIYDLELNKKGSINDFFIPFNSTINKEKMVDAIKTNKIGLPSNVLLMFYEYHKNTKCDKK